MTVNFILSALQTLRGMLWLTAWLSLRLSWGWVNANEEVQLLIFYCPSPDFTSGCGADTRGHFNCLSVGTQQSLRFAPALCPPTCKLLPTPLLSLFVWSTLSFWLVILILLSLVRDLPNCHATTKGFLKKLWITFHCNFKTMSIRLSVWNASIVVMIFRPQNAENCKLTLNLSFI